MQKGSTGATLDHSGALGERLLPLISEAEKAFIVPQREQGNVLWGKLAHFLSDCVFRGLE